MSKERPELWRLGKTAADGFINPEHSLVYIRNDDDPFGGVILSVEDMAKIIVAHQARRRISKRTALFQA